MEPRVLQSKLLIGMLSARKRAIKRADEARDRRDAAAAAILYHTVIKRWGSHFGILVQLGNARKDSGAFNEAEQAYKAALELKPGDADCHLQYGHLKRLSGSLERARELYAEAGRLSPPLSAETDELQFDILVQLGNTLKDSGRIDEAERAYRSALELKPNDADCHLQYGHLMRLAGDLARAQELYAEAGRLDPSLSVTVDELHFNILVQLGNERKDSGAFDEAEQAYTSALELNSEDADCYLQYGHLMKLSGDLTRARELYTEASRLNPTLSAATDELRALESRAASSSVDVSKEALDVESSAAQRSQATPIIQSHRRSHGWDLDAPSLVVCEQLFTTLQWRRN
jgi:tetratricopeptide (TPR) repeat protein